MNMCLRKIVILVGLYKDSLNMKDNLIKDIKMALKQTKKEKLKTQKYDIIVEMCIRDSEEPYLGLTSR